MGGSVDESGLPSELGASRGGFATITSRYDRAAIAHPGLVVPASFPDEHDERPRYENGSVAYS